MAPVATLLGGFVGTFAAIIALVFFDASLAMAAAVYFSAAFSLVVTLIACTLVSKRAETGFPVLEHQDAGLAQQT